MNKNTNHNLKKIIRGKKVFILLAAILLLTILFFVFPRHATQEKVSDYLTLSDGTRLAYDSFLPANDGVPANGSFPTLFKYTPYNRAWTIFDKDGHYNFDMPGAPWYAELAMRIRKLIISLVVPDGNGNIQDVVARTEWIGDMIKSGYAVIVVDRPGSGASFGRLAADPDIIANETDEILNWIAAQRWCDGNIGMFGDSIQAQIQFQAASTGNPHLKAILPATTWIDQYSSTVFPGGVANKAFGNTYEQIQKVFNKIATPVDSDTDGTLLAQARAERGGTSELAKAIGGAKTAPFRDVMTSDGQNLWIDHMTLYPLLEKINQVGVPVYLINGWYDIYARDNFMIYANLNVPKRLLVRPTNHSGIEAPGSDIDFAVEAHRWFDYWLKGIDNGIMDELPIHYYLQGVEKKQAMQSTDVWPLKNQVMTRYYFETGGTTGKLSINNGALNLSPPTDSQAFDSYTVDYSTTTGATPHWTGLAFGHKYPNMRSRDAKSLTYTTPPLATTTNIVGHPVIHLWLSTEAPDLDAFVYLEEVDRKGNSIYISQDNLRASHRTPSQAPFENLGLPWYNHFESELQPILANEPFELVFDLLPTAYQFSKGNSIRITIAFADAENFDTPVLDPPPTLKLLRNTNYQTYVELPVIHN